MFFGGVNCCYCVVDVCLFVCVSLSCFLFWGMCFVCVFCCHLFVVGYLLPIVCRGVFVVVVVEC